MSPDLADALAEFYRTVWDPTTTGAALLRARSDEARRDPSWPGVEVPTVLAVQGSRVIGHLSTIPMRMWAGGEEVAGYWLKGLMILPEYRKGPLGFALVKEMSELLDVAFATAVQPAAWKLFQACGFTHVGVATNLLRVLRPSRLLARLDLDALGLDGLPPWMPRALRLAQRTGVAGVGGLVLAGVRDTWTVMRSEAAHGLRANLDTPRAADVDALWREARRGFATGAVRDGAYFAWRYAGQEDYRLVAVRDRGKLVALAALRLPRASGHPRLPGIQLATISDVVVAPARADALAALLAGTERAAHDLGADALLCSATHARLVRALRTRAYVAIPGTLNVLARTVDGHTAVPRDVATWWVTRADGNADEGV
jgi:hypothetical protein